MISATRIRIYPDTKQAEKLTKAFGSARWYWNNSLAETQRLYKETGKGLGQYSFNARLPALKKELPWLGETHSQVLQSVSLHLSRAFIKFFEKRAEYPKFKAKHGKQSIQYPQGVKVVDGRKLYLPKIGHIKAVVHRPIEGKIKTVTITKSPSGRYFAAILTEIEDRTTKVSFEGKVLGVDVGLTHLAVTSDGSKYDNPRHVERAKKNLKRKQQKLSRKLKGSKRRDKARVQVAKVHEKVTNARQDYLHKLSSRLVHENQVIAVEDLYVKGMLKNHNLARAISDAGWGKFKAMLRYKTARAGKGYIEVDRFFPSSKLCSACLQKHHALSISTRMWTCSNCGIKHDRDINAAINICNEAKRLIAAGIVATASGGEVRQGRGRRTSTFAHANEAGNPTQNGAGNSPTRENTNIRENTNETRRFSIRSIHKNRTG